MIIYSSSWLYEDFSCEDYYDDDTYYDDSF